jgi:prepilin-type processing-associated H-X9-DG protein
MERSSRLESCDDRPHGAAGFTQLELLIVLGILGLLAAIGIPAVLAAREASRRLDCESRIRQIVLASQNYHDAHGIFPVGYEPFRILLPYMDQRALYERLSRREPVEFGVTAYICPSDSGASAAKGHCNYLLNEGNGLFQWRYPDFHLNGIRLRHYLVDEHPTRISDLTDGPSQTAYLSERLVPIADRRIPDDEARRDPIAFRWYLDRRYRIPDQHAEFREACLAMSPATATSLPRLSTTNFYGIQANHGYDHLIPPNRPGCYIGVSERVHDADGFMGATPATSRHRGGVGVGFADGHVRFVSEQIAMRIWDAYGTRNGGETIHEE